MDQVPHQVETLVELGSKGDLNCMPPNIRQLEKQLPVHGERLGYSIEPRSSDSGGAEASVSVSGRFTKERESEIHAGFPSILPTIFGPELDSEVFPIWLSFSLARFQSAIALPNPKVFNAK